MVVCVFYAHAVRCREAACLAARQFGVYFIWTLKTEAPSHGRHGLAGSRMLLALYVCYCCTYAYVHCLNNSARVPDVPSVEEKLRRRFLLAYLRDRLELSGYQYSTRSYI